MLHRQQPRHSALPFVQPDARTEAHPHVAAVTPQLNAVDPGRAPIAGAQNTAVPFQGMFDAPTPAVAAAPVAAANTTPHNGYTKAELEALYPDSLGYTAENRKFKDIDFWANRIAAGEGAFNTAGDLNDGGRLSVGILQWTQDSGRLGRLLSGYQQAAHRENKDALFDQTFGGTRNAQNLVTSLTGNNPDAIAPSSIQGQFHTAGNIDTFKRVQIEQARADTRSYLPGVANMIPHGEDGAVSGKQLAAALIANNIGPDSPTRIFKAVDDQLYAGIRNQRPDVQKQLGLRSDADLATYRHEHAEELAAMSPAERSQAEATQQAATKQKFYNGLAGKYGDVSAQANQQTDAALLQYEAAHHLDPQNAKDQDAINQARADIGIQQYAQLVSRGPTIGQRLETQAQTETTARTTANFAEYEQSHAAELAKLSPNQRVRTEARERTRIQSEASTAVHGELVRKAVQDNVSESDYDSRLVTEVPKQLYSPRKYRRYHTGVENRVRDAMAAVEDGTRVDTSKL